MEGVSVEASPLICVIRASATGKTNAATIVAGVPKPTVADRALPSGQVRLACSLKLKLQRPSTPASLLGSLPCSLSHDSELRVPTLIYVG